MPLYRVRVSLEPSEHVLAKLAEWKIGVLGPTGVGDCLLALVLATSDAHAERAVAEALAPRRDVPLESLGPTRWPSRRGDAA
jgi:hypothetical protein